MTFSILIITYYPEWKKLHITLESILRQKFKDYEIVITDDGSDDDLSNEIIQYFSEKGFDNYTLVPHEKNQGTVKNLISGLEHCRGQYIRDFGPGDFFYSSDSLGKVYEFMKNTGCDSCFGLLKGYYVNPDNTIDKSDFPHPFDIDAYKENDKNRIIKNLVWYRDNASGASTCYKREFIYNYLKKIEDKVLYLEDITQIMMAIDGNVMSFYPDYLVWYELDSGVSAKKSSFNERLQKDVNSFYELLFNLYPDNKYVKKQKLFVKFYKIKSLMLRNVLRIFVNPDMIGYALRHRNQLKNESYKGIDTTYGFLESDFLFDYM